MVIGDLWTRKVITTESIDGGRIYRLRIKRKGIIGTGLIRITPRR